MRTKTGILLTLMVLTVFSCKEPWDDHYLKQPETVDENVWDAIQRDPELSVFVDYIKEFSYDTLFEGNSTFTIFTPDNDAMNSFLDTGTVTRAVIDYHFAEMHIQPGIVSGKRKIQTLAEKFALLEKYGSVVLLDGLELDFESPLYRNGKYFKMSHVAIPKPNLYEFFALTNPILKRFIDEQDSIILDRAKSRPIGFDQYGNTVYDSVTDTINIFEEEYFPVKHEFRNKTATIAFPQAEVYNSALELMAITLGDDAIEGGDVFDDYSDIPYDWQEEVLIPQLLYQGVFENMIEETEFFPRYEEDSVKLKNILGDSVVIRYTIGEKSICSNGYAYDYVDYTVPDTLYMEETVFEAEWLLRATGIDKYAWFEEEATVTSDISIKPSKNFILTASADSIIMLNFPYKYSGEFILDFKGPKLFPRKYLMVVGTHIDIGGIYDIYVNDELVKHMDWYDYRRRRGIYSSVTGKLIPPEGRYNIFDCWVESILEYGKARVRFEYTGPGSASSNGLIIDYLEFIPASRVDELFKY